MCGIVGYIGDKKASPVLLDGLKRLEYRGYDSAGIAVQAPSGKVTIVKEKGRLSELFRAVSGVTLNGCCGIGHTRWATHGKPDFLNAHPHRSEDGLTVGVHNGIIENYLPLKEELETKGYRFISETDTEVAISLIDFFYRRSGDPVSALSKFSERAKGAYAIAVLFHDRPEEIFAIRKDSPMIVGVCEGESFLASDAPAILKYTRNVYYIENRRIVHLKKGSVKFFTFDGEETSAKPVQIDWDLAAAERGGYEHFMLKEICEQPDAVRSTLGCFLRENEIDFGETGLKEEDLRKVKRIVVAGCGSAYHVGVVARHVFEKLTRLPVFVELSSELRYRDFPFSEGDLVIIVSQSGETADSLAALRYAKDRGVPVLSVVNVVGSSIARESDFVLYTKAGPEISVATTKAYSCQLVAIYLLALRLAKIRGLEEEIYRSYSEELNGLPEKIQTVLDGRGLYEEFARSARWKKDVFYIGRGIDYAVALEGSLKLKEISYLHSEAYAAGELKHGTISLIEEGTPLVCILADGTASDKTVVNAEEAASRGADLTVITREGGDLPKNTRTAFYLPKIADVFSASLSVLPLQLIAYYTCIHRGIDADHPRNLAKSVTVE